MEKLLDKSSFLDLIMLVAILLKPNVKTDKPIVELFMTAVGGLGFSNKEIEDTIEKIDFFKKEINKLFRDYKLDKNDLLLNIVLKMSEIDAQKCIKVEKNIFRSSFKQFYYYAALKNNEIAKYIKLYNLYHYEQYNILLDYIKMTLDFSVLDNNWLPHASFCNYTEEIILDPYANEQNFYKIYFKTKIWLNSFKLLKEHFILRNKINNVELIFRISTILFYHLDKDALKFFANILSKKNSYYYSVPESLFFILEKNEKEAVEKLAELISYLKKTDLKTRYLKRSIILWYAFLLFKKYDIKDKFKILWEHFQKDSKQTLVGEISKLVILNKDISSYVFDLPKDFDAMHIVFYTSLFKRRTNILEYKFKTISQIIPFFEKEIMHIKKKKKISFTSLYKLIKEVNVYALEDVEELKKFLTKFSENTKELVWVYNDRDILPYQKTKLKNGKYIFKPLDLFSLAKKRYKWLSEEDKIFENISTDDYDDSINSILKLIVGKDKFYYTEDNQNFTKIKLKKSMATLYIDVINNSNVIVFPKYYIQEKWFFSGFYNVMFYQNVYNEIIKGISDYLTIHSLKENKAEYSYFKLANKKDFQDIILLLTNFYIFEIFDLKDDSLPYDKKIDYDNFIYMYVGKKGDDFAINFLLKPFEDLDLLIPLVFQKALLLKKEDKVYFINLELEKFFILRQQLRELKYPLKILLKSFDELLNLIIQFKSFPFIKIVILEDLLFKDVHKVKKDDFNIKETLVGNYFEISGEITLDNKKVIKFTDLLRYAFEAKGNFIKLKNGEYIVVDDEIIEQLKILSTISLKEKNNIKFHKKLKLFMPSSKDLLLSKSDLNKKIEEVKNKIYKIPKGFKGVLRRYQIEGFNWLSQMYELELGACLADDMGLGKTIQAIVFMENVKNNKPFLVVAPVSLMYNWEREIKRFSNNLKPILYHLERDVDLNKLDGNNVVLVSYNLLVNESAKFLKTEFNVIIFDESQMVKNPKTNRSIISKKLKSFQKISLTGTPVENNLIELWNLMDLLNPGIFGTIENFKKKFKDSEDRLNLLKKVIKPFVLRRSKEEVLIELPEKTEITIDYQMPEKEYSFYAAVQLAAKEKIKKFHEDNFKINNVSILSEIVRLKLACCHPKLVTDKIDIEQSSKEEIFLQLVEDVVLSGHKALVFSQFVKFLKILQDRLSREKIPFLYMDGSTSMKNRRKIISQFQTDENIQIFLLSLKTGGLGLNLTAADIVIHLDPWWNPAAEKQASDRVYRIGQEKPVTIYKLIAKNTIEEKILNLQEKKKRLAEFLMEDMDKIETVSIEDLLELLM